MNAECAIASVERVAVEWVQADLHQLKLSFSQLRIQAPTAVDRLSRSIEQHGQQVPVVAVVDSSCWTLIDGYRRFEALRRCGEDRIWVELWQCELSSGLLRMFARGQARYWQALEEAGLIRELIEQFSCSQRDIARYSGRDVSWVSRRLALIERLPEAVIAAVRQGRISSWIATRVMVPLARANTAHALALLDALQNQAMSSRELLAWFEHYQRTNPTTRARLVQAPHIFVEALREKRAQRRGECLRMGPQGHWLADLKRIRRLSQRLIEQLPAVFDSNSPEQYNPLLASFDDTARHFGELATRLKRYRENG